MKLHIAYVYILPMHEVSANDYLLDVGYVELIQGDIIFRSEITHLEFIDANKKRRASAG